MWIETLDSEVGLSPVGNGGGSVVGSMVHEDLSLMRWTRRGLSIRGWSGPGRRDEEH